MEDFRMFLYARIKSYTAVVRLSVPFTLSSQILLNPWGIWMKLGTKKDPNLEICILKGECCAMFFEGVWALGLRIFYAKYFVFATPP